MAGTTALVHESTMKVNLAFGTVKGVDDLRKQLSIDYGGTGAGIQRHTGRLQGALGKAGVHAGQKGAYGGFGMLDLEKFALVVRQASRTIAMSTKALASIMGIRTGGLTTGTRGTQGLLGTGGGLQGEGTSRDQIFGGRFDFAARGAAGEGGPTPPEVWQEAGTAKDKYKTNLEKLRKKKKQVKEETTGFINKIVEMGSKLRSISRLFFYASLDMQQFANVILGPMTQGVRVFGDYNKTMTQMWVNFEFISQSGDAALSILGDKFNELAEATEFSRQEIAQAAAVFGTANVAVESISESMDGLASLARVNFMSMEDMARITLKTMRRFNLTLEEAGDEMWRLTAISQKTGESIQLIAGQLGYASELGQQLGYSFGEIAAQMTILTEVYGSASIAGRRLSSVYGSLIAKGEEYGVQIRDMNGEMLSARDQVAGLADYLDLIADPLEQNQYLMQLFGTSGAASARAIVDAFREGRWDELVEGESDATVDALTDISNVIKDELYVSIQSLDATLKDFVSRLGESLLPLLEELLPPLTSLVTEISVWIKDNKDLAISLAALAVALTALAGVTKVLGFIIEITVAIAHLASGIMTLGSAISYAFATLSAIAAALFVPLWAVLLVIGLIIAVIIVVIGAIIGFIKTIQELAKTNKGLQSILKIVHGWLRQIWAVITIIIKVVLIVIGALLALGIIIGTVIAHVVAWVAALEPVAWFLDVIATAANWLGDVLEDISDVLDGVIGGFADFLSGFLPGSPTLAERIWEVGEALGDTMGPMKEFTTWGRRLTASTGKMKAQMGIHYGESTAKAMAGLGGDQGATYITQVDGAYIQDPEELVEIILNRQSRGRVNSYRSTAY